MSDTPTRIHFTVLSYWACAWYRGYVPGVELKKRGHDVVLDTEFRMAEVADYDVIVVQTGASKSIVELMRRANELGKTTVYDIDDDVFNIPPTNQAYETWVDPERRAGAKEAIRLASVVTTTTPHLARELRQLNPNVRVLPNMLPSEYWNVERPDNGDKVIVGWAGSGSRSADLGMIRTVIPNLLDRYPQMEFHVTGDDNAEAFAPHPRIRVLDGVQIEQLADLVAPFDIGLAPIRDTKFNLAKSDLKFLEYGILGIPTVASWLEPYMHSIRPGENGMLAKSDKDWLKLLSKLIEDVGLRKRMGAAAKAYAETRTIERNIHLWEDAYGLR